MRPFGEHEFVYAFDRKRNSQRLWVRVRGPAQRRKELFDCDLLKIDPETTTVRLRPNLKGSQYWQYEGTLHPRLDGSEIHT
jgi:hypothetical protein